MLTLSLFLMNLVFGSIDFLSSLFQFWPDRIQKKNTNRSRTPWKYSKQKHLRTDTVRSRRTELDWDEWSDANGLETHEYGNDWEKFNYGNERKKWNLSNWNWFIVKLYRIDSSSVSHFPWLIKIESSLVNYNIENVLSNDGTIRRKKYRDNPR